MRIEIKKKNTELNKISIFILYLCINISIHKCMHRIGEEYTNIIEDLDLYSDKLEKIKKQVFRRS